MLTGDQLKAARKLLDWSQMKLAHEANVAQQTIGKFETSSRTASR
jgi:DNA-binding XRE family transcriptional regulator